MKRQMKSHSCKCGSSVFIIIYLIFFVILIANCKASFLSGTSNMLHQVDEDDQSNRVLESIPAHSRSRKLMMMKHGECTRRDISISQSKGSSSGIPQYIVQIVNTCMSDCAPSNIHLHCGWFASARIVNPNTFKRLAFDDCLVNAGMPLRKSQTIRFSYSNSFMYPLVLKSARFC